MSYNKVLYVSSGSYSYRRAKVGGFISSANGVIEGLLANHYDLDFITDSKLPGLLNGNIRYHYYDYRTLRKLLPIDFLKHIKTLPFVNKLFRVLLYIDAVLFKMSIDITLNRVLRKNRYDFIYMRSSASGSYVAKISRIYDIPLVLEVNKPQSMGPYNNRNSLAWPSSKKDVYVSDNERIQYEIASVITVDSTLRGKWITEFVDANMRDKIVVNPNAVNSDMFKPCDDVQDIKQLYLYICCNVLIVIVVHF